MKSLFLVLLLAALAYAVEEVRVPEARLPVVVSNATQCVYNKREERLSCRDGEEVVECDAAFEFEREEDEKRFKIFGLGARDFGEEKNYRSLVFCLYPRGLDNSSYVNESARWSLYQSEKRGDLGFRVEKASCYERLIRVFLQADDKHVVKIGERNVTLFGEILTLDRSVQKRWFYGYGFYPYFNGFWGWYGWPYYGGLFWGRK